MFRDRSRRLGRRTFPAPAEGALERPPLQGSIDCPAPGDVVPRGILTIGGWHVSGDSPAQAVFVSVNGSIAGVGRVGSAARPDVVAVLGNNRAVRSGWSVDIDLTDVIGEDVELGVSVWESIGALPTDLPPIHITVAAPANEPKLAEGSLHAPGDGAVLVGDVLKVAGWCLFEGSRVARVEVFVDGRSAGLALAYIDRLDVSLAHGNTDAPVAGFELLCNMEGHGRSAESLVTVEATSLDGRRWRSPTHRVHWAALISAEYCRNEPQSNQGQRPSGERSNVLIVTPDLSPGLTQLWLSELAPQLTILPEIEIVVLSMFDGPVRAVLEDLGATVHVMAPWRVDSPDAYEGQIGTMTSLMEVRGIGVVLGNSLAVFPAIDAAARAGIPTLWAIRESVDPVVFAYVQWGPLGMHPYVQRQFKGCFQSARAVTFEASQTAELFAPLGSPDRYIVIDCGVDIDEIDKYRNSTDRVALRRAMGFDDDDVVMIMVGSLKPDLAQAAAAAAFDELAVVHDRLRLVLVGAGNDPYSAAVRDQVARSQSGVRVELVPSQSDSRPWYAIADLLLCTSDVESLARSILEAMAFELPVVATDSCGAGELIIDGRTGWLSRPRDLEGLVGLLHLVLRMAADERRSVGVQARRELLRRCTDRWGARAYVRALGDLLRDPSCNLSPALSRIGRRESEVEETAKW